MNLENYTDGFFEVNHINGFLPLKSPLATLPIKYNEIQALIDAAAPVETGCGSAISTGSVIFFVLSATAIASTVFIARKKKEISE